MMEKQKADLPSCLKQQIQRETAHATLVVKKLYIRKYKKMILDITEEFNLMDAEFQLGMTKNSADG